MALVPKLDLRHVQTLIMTPQLQQAIKLLQLSNLELAEYIENELEQNPLLEREDPDGGPATADPPDVAAQDDASGREPGEEPGEDRAELAALAEDGFDQPDSVDLTGGEDITGDNDAALDTDYDNVWNSDSSTDAAGGGGDALYWRASGVGFDDGESVLEGAHAGEVSLRDHLLGQINVDLDDPVDRVIAVHLADLLDESGYITNELADIAATLGCTLGRVEAALEKVQRFDPPGIFARGLAECLTLQLRDRNRFDPTMAALIANLDLLAKRDFAALKKICGVDGEALSRLVTEIKSLDPKPALAFDASVAQPITPDVLVRRQRSGGWAVELNPDTLPRVLVNNRYHAVISRKAGAREDKEYIDNCYQAANWLVKALHQRAQTILRVATELVKRQDEFLSRGVQHLRPLVLRDIATVLDIHESTVSRVTNNKYMATPRGIFEMKYFFTFALGDSGGGDTHSAEAIRFRIKSLIESETPDDVLSDDRIVELLRRDGVDIARRTVAKYRESMQIPSSVRRRREKILEA